MKHPHPQLSAQRGAIGLVALAVALPVLLLLIAAMTDLLRPESVGADLQRVFQRVNTGLNARLDPAVTTNIIGYHLPAAYNLQTKFASAMPAPSYPAGGSTERIGVLDPGGTTGAEAIVALACQIASESLQSGSRKNFLTQAGADVSYAFQFAVTELEIVDESKVTSTWAVSANSPPCAGQDFNVLSQSLGLSVDAAALTSEMANRFVEPPNGGYSWDGGGNAMIPFEGWSVNWNVPAYDNMVPTYWLVGVAIARVSGLFGDVIAGEQSVVENFAINLAQPFAWQNSTPYMPAEPTPAPEPDPS